MEIRSKFSRRRKKKDPFLRIKVASAIQVFISIHGYDWLKNGSTAVVLRDDYAPFVTRDVEGIENRESVISLVYLKQMDSFQDFKTIQADAHLRASALGQAVLNQLADQVASQLSKVAERVV
jgi:hypothetical protein